jgi:hypothetical protein
MSGGNHASTMLLQGAQPLRGDPLERCLRVAEADA